MQAIKTVELVKRYKKLTAVDRLHLEIQQGELFSLLGVNGAGKTTAIKMLSCLTKPTEGNAMVGGYSITKEPEHVKRLISVSPQETAVAPNLISGRTYPRSGCDRTTRPLECDPLPERKNYHYPDHPLYGRSRGTF